MAKCPAEIFIQWKGTDVCLDFYCHRCQTQSHFDGAFAYYLQCPTCQTYYGMPVTLALVALDQKPDTSCIQTPTDPSESTVTPGRELEERQVEYNGEGRFA